MIVCDKFGMSHVITIHGLTRTYDNELEFDASVEGDFECETSLGECYERYTISMKKDFEYIATLIAYDEYGDFVSYPAEEENAGEIERIFAIRQKIS